MALTAAGCKSGGGSESGESGGSDFPSISADFKGNTAEVKPKAGDLIAAFEIEGYGTVKAVLFPEAAPVGVENFKKLCEAGYYNGLTVHRVMKDFMFQGGSLNGDGTGGEALVEGGSFGVETHADLRHFYGALCYANAAGRNTTQFYIVNNKTYDPAEDVKTLEEELEELRGMIKDAENSSEQEALEYYRYYEELYVNTIASLGSYAGRGGTPGLDGSYTVFGQVYEGFDVIDGISAAEVKRVDESDEKSELSVPVQPIIIKSVYVSEYVEG